MHKWCVYFALVILFIMAYSASEPEYSEAFEKIQGKWVMNYWYYEISTDIYRDTFTVTADFDFCEFMKHKYSGAWDNSNFKGKAEWYDDDDNLCRSFLEFSLKNTSLIIGKSEENCWIADDVCFFWYLHFKCYRIN